MHTNNIENNKIITTLQAENKQLNQKMGKLQQQINKQPDPYIEDSANFQQNINATCIIILKQDNDTNNSTVINSQTDNHKRKRNDKKNHRNSKRHHKKSNRPKH